MKKGLLLLLSVICMLPALAQIRTLAGKVTSDSSGVPLPGVTIRIKGSTYRVASGEDGTFSIAISGNQELLFSMMGYASKQVMADQATTWLDVRLKPDLSKLSEVVIVGYGEQTKRYTTEAVSVIKPDAILNVPALTPQQLLQGQVAGVQMTNSSGLLGSASLLRIRGAASITADGQPLFVVDDVPLNAGLYSSPTSGSLGSSGLNPLLEINPNDIESITVLKDAAAAAIYGSRGSNGVVIIKTKKGAINNKTSVQFDYYTGWIKPTNTLEVMGAEDYRTFYNNYITTATGKPLVVFPAKGFDWPGAIQKTGKTNNYSLSASGGNDKTKFYAGGSYLKEGSFIIGNEMKKLTGRLNLDHTMNKHVRFGINFSTAYSDMNKIPNEGDANTPYAAGMLNLPFKQAYDSLGQFVNPPINTLAVIGLNKNKYYTRRNTGNAYAEINITGGLSVRTDWGIDQLNTEERFRVSSKVAAGGEAGRTLWQDYKWLNTTGLHYDKTIAKQHHLELLAAHSFETARYDDIKVGGTGFINDDLVNTGSAAVPNATSATGQEWAMESYIFRGNYRYQDKYLAEVTVRRDGSSRFGKNKKYGDFWAVSGGWVISQEQFMRSVSFIDYLKLTASYGITGNDGIGYYTYLGLYSSGGAGYANQPGLRPGQAPNANLSWEETRQLDIGLTTNILNNRIQLSVNYYNKDTKDLLLAVAYPSTTGFGSGNKNVGKMRNTGVDLQITANAVRSRNFEWTTSINAGFLKNRVLELPADLKDEDGRHYVNGSVSGQRAIQGYALNSFYLVRYKGINAATGDPEWYTKNGETTTAPTDKDRVVAGNAIPKVTGGFNNTFRYKDFDMGVNFYFSLGSKVMFSEFQYLDDVTRGTNLSRDMLGYWKKPGDLAFAASPASPSWQTGHVKQSALSTAQLFDGSYLRLRTLTLGYHLPEKLLSSTHVVRSARIYVLGQNLWTAKSKEFRGSDPEVSRFGSLGLVTGESFFSLPQPKTITVGVNLVF